MDNNITDYSPGPASLFSTAAREAEPIIIWAYCGNSTCWTQTDQMFLEDDGICVTYICTICGCKRKVAVR